MKTPGPMKTRSEATRGEAMCLEQSASTVWLAAPTMNACETLTIEV